LYDRPTTLLPGPTAAAFGPVLPKEALRGQYSDAPCRSSAVSLKRPRAGCHAQYVRTGNHDGTLRPGGTAITRTDELRERDRRPGYPQCLHTVRKQLIGALTDVVRSVSHSYDHHFVRTHGRSIATRTRGRTSVEDHNLSIGTWSSR
jgi:hypothetical protein